jgi:lysophospholipase L1-like esterase
MFTGPFSARRIFDAGSPLRITGFALAIVAICLSLTACGTEHPALKPLAAEAKLLAFGDSLTRGTGADDTSSYPAVLAELTGLEIVNAGIPGELSAAGLRRLPRVLADTRPQLMILCHGGNDMLRRYDLNATADNLRAMVELAQSRAIDVVLLGVPKPGLLLGAPDFYAEIATSMNIPAELEILSKVLADARLKSDPIHPNAAGYRRIAEALRDRLVDAGAL